MQARLRVELVKSAAAWRLPSSGSRFEVSAGCFEGIQATIQGNVQGVPHVVEIALGLPPVIEHHCQHIVALVGCQLGNRGFERLLILRLHQGGYAEPWQVERRTTHR
jgi:hypothetical protein